MARRDGTGPMGAGAMTGRGLGVCPGAAAPMYGNYYGGSYPGRGPGCGRGFARGGGRGFGFSPHVALSKDMLKAQKDQLESLIESIDKELEEL